MLFNSIEFLLFFLPVVLTVFLLLKRFGYGRLAVSFLGIASLFFYGWWDIRFLGLLLLSVLFNFSIGLYLLKKAPSHILLIMGIVGNLLCLGFFKYFNFFIENINFTLGQDITVPSIILPLGISFFTFQQIAYLVDAYNRKAEEHSFIDYLVFVAFFPQLIAGPIVHHKIMMSQFRDHASKPYDWAMASMGLSIFAIGLFKKVVLADTLAAHVSPVYTAADTAGAISFVEGWAGAIGYTFQLYFDFSGYSDMAIGLGLLFCVRLPANFMSPYKATSIIDFWHRWHITLSVFLKDYLYIPLGGNRRGKLRRYVNLIITMVLGGLWHGAAWTFVFWGALHGTYLIINHAWRKAFPQFSQCRSFWVRALGGLVTLVAVIIGWVFFRSGSIETALVVLTGMSGVNGVFQEGANSLGSLDSSGVFTLIVVSAFIIFILPNSMQIIGDKGALGSEKWYAWAPNMKWVMFTTILLLTSLYLIVYKTNRISEFIYFQF